MLIIVLDPGKTTGLVTFDTVTAEFTAHELNFDDTCNVLKTLLDTAIEGADVHVISESFIITQQTAKNTQAPWSLELIGVARYLSRQYTGRDLVLQQPAAAKRFSSDARVKAMGWWTPAKGHANDAARHLLLFTATRGFISEERLVEFANMP